METAVSKGRLYLDLCQCHRTEGDPRPNEAIFKEHLSLLLAGTEPMSPDWQVEVTD